jgi:hypothetical protein
MSNMEDKYVKASEIEITGNLVKQVMFKNPIPAIATAITGAALFLLKDTATTVIGIVLIIAALYYIFIAKDRHTVDVYDDSVVIYSENDQTMARKIMYDDIYEWSFFDSNVKNSCIILTLNDYSTVTTTTFQLSKYFNALRTTIPDKELRQKQLNAAHEKIQSFKIRSKKKK